MRSHNPFQCKKYRLEKHPNYIFLADAAKTDEERMERTFQISSIHAKTVKELNYVATSSNEKSSGIDLEKKPAAENKKAEIPEFDSITETVLIDTSSSETTYIDELALFENQEIKIYGDEELTNDEIAYEEVNLEMERFDFGEPIRGKEEKEYENQEQVTPDIINPDGSIDEVVVTNNNDSEHTQEYEVPDTVATPIECLNSDNINEAVVSTSESPVTSDNIYDDDLDMDDLFR